MVQNTVSLKSLNTRLTGLTAIVEILVHARGVVHQEVEITVASPQHFR